MASRVPKINPGAVVAAAAGVGGLAGLGYLGYNSIYSGEARALRGRWEAALPALPAIAPLAAPRAGASSVKVPDACVWRIAWPLSPPGLARNGGSLLEEVPRSNGAAGALSPPPPGPVAAPIVTGGRNHGVLPQLRRPVLLLMRLAATRQRPGRVRLRRALLSVARASPQPGWPSQSRVLPAGRTTSQPMCWLGLLNSPGRPPLPPPLPVHPESHSVRLRAWRPVTFAHCHLLLACYRRLAVATQWRVASGP